MQHMDNEVDEKLNGCVTQLEEETKHVMELCNIPSTPITQEEVCTVCDTSCVWLYSPFLYLLSTFLYLLSTFLYLFLFSSSLIYFPLSLIYFPSSLIYFPLSLIYFSSSLSTFLHLLSDVYQTYTVVRYLT